MPAKSAIAWYDELEEDIPIMIADVSTLLKLYEKPFLSFMVKPKRSIFFPSPLPELIVASGIISIYALLSTIFTSMVLLLLYTKRNDPFNPKALNSNKSFTLSGLSKGVPSP